MPSSNDEFVEAGDLTDDSDSDVEDFEESLNDPEVLEALIRQSDSTEALLTQIYCEENDAAEEEEFLDIQDDELEESLGVSPVELLK